MVFTDMTLPRPYYDFKCEFLQQKQPPIDSALDDGFTHKIKQGLMVYIEYEWCRQQVMTEFLYSVDHPQGFPFGRTVILFGLW